MFITIDTQQHKNINIFFGMEVGNCDILLINICKQYVLYLLLKNKNLITILMRYFSDG